jgi:putative ABC transport system permease protein
MLELIVKRLIRRPWLPGCLLGGLIAAVALTSSVPMYINGVLKRVLIRDFENYQLEQDQYPGGYLVEKNFWKAAGEGNEPACYPEFDSVVASELLPSLKLPAVEAVHRVSLSRLSAEPLKPYPSLQKNRSVRIEVMPRLMDHIRITHGRSFAGLTTDSAVEVLVSERTMQHLDLRLNRTYAVRDMDNNTLMDIVVVGTFLFKHERDPYWYMPTDDLDDSVFVNPERWATATEQIVSYPSIEADWYYALDYHEITPNMAGSLLAQLEGQARELLAYEAGYDIPMVQVLPGFLDKKRQLLQMIALLIAPVLVVLGFFVYMVSSLIIENDNSEIALLKSRGASPGNVFLIYLGTAMGFAVAAFAIGPFVGLLICRRLAMTVGFLEFGTRASLPVSLSRQAFLYGGVGVAPFVVTLLLPAFSTSKTTIVVHKHAVSRHQRVPLWQRAFLDVVLLGIAAYGLYGYRTRQRILQLTEASSADLPMDPLFFVASVLFVFGAALLFLRLFPPIVQLILRMGSRVWSPTIYAALIRISRSRSYERYVAVFLVLTVATGVFNSAMARTMNRRVKDEVYYRNGADVRLRPFWYTRFTREDLLEVANVRREIVHRYPQAAENADPRTTPPDTPWIHKREPDFRLYSEIEGVEKATAVFRKSRVDAARSDRQNGLRVRTTILGVTPEEFGHVAWFRSDLLTHHWHEYLNLLAEYPSAVFVSPSLAKELRIGPGERVRLAWEGQAGVDCIVFGFIDYWPTYVRNGNGRGEPGHFVVGHFNTLRTGAILEPYEVWIKRDRSVGQSRFYTDLLARHIRLSLLADSIDELAYRMNQPFVTGTNGILTLNFAITLVITFVGLLLSQVLSVQRWTLQFGLIRALGLPKGQVLLIPIWEQLLTATTAAVAGLGVGSLTSKLYVPLLSLSAQAEQNGPPLLIGALQRDYNLLVAAVLAVFIAAFAVSTFFVLRLRIHKAIKLGED